MKFKFYHPAFVDTPDIPDFEFKNLEDLLNYRKSIFPNNENVKGFYQCSLTKQSYEERYCLMKEYNKGKEWWVIGFIEGEEEEIKSLNLPNWSYRTGKKKNKI